MHQLSWIICTHSAVGTADKLKELWSKWSIGQFTKHKPHHLTKSFPALKDGHYPLLNSSTLANGAPQISAVLTLLVLWLQISEPPLLQYPKPLTPQKRADQHSALLSCTSSESCTTCSKIQWHLQCFQDSKMGGQKRNSIHYLCMIMWLHLF